MLAEIKRRTDGGEERAHRNAPPEQPDDVIWTAIIPLKRNEASKSRLADCLSPGERLALGDAMADVVVRALQATPCVGEIRILSQTDWSRAGVAWEPDEGQGLNAELQRVRSQLHDRALLIVHGDLPFLTAGDVLSLCASARDGIALAPDRHRSGTNAVALMPDIEFAFAFGDRSFSKHRAQTRQRCGAVFSDGLSRDVDTPDDLRTPSGSPILLVETLLVGGHGQRARGA